MVQLFQQREQPTKPPSFLQSVVGGIAEGAPQAFAQHFENKKMKQQMAQENEAASRLGIDISGIQDPKIRQQAVQLALQGKNQQELENQRRNQDLEYEGRDYQIIKNNFGEKFANVWRAAPTGGRTALLQTAIESSKRGHDLDELLGDQVKNPQQTNEILEENTGKEIEKSKIDKEINDYISKRDEGLLPSEKVARGKERFDTGFKIYQEAGNKLRAFTRDKERVDVLENLDKSNKLPRNFERLNVDQEGNLRLPFLASPEAQRFVKTLNEFSASAKDTFGSRVTNFDLQQYLKRFPNLLNSKEGRRQIYEQMKIVNHINSIYYKNLKDVYDKAGGVRNIDADVAERFADKLSEDKIEQLSQKFKEIGQFTLLPAANEFNGKKIRDKETGEIFISDGNNWIPAE